MTKRAAVIGTSAVLAVAGGTAAFAYAAGWFKGDGTATATTSTIQNVHATITVAGKIYPGLSVPITTDQINNPNDYPVLIKDITVTGIAGNPGGCDQSKAGFSFNSLPANTTVAKGISAHDVPLGNIVLSPDADPVCANKALTVNVTLAGEIAPS
jgi:hypothetical protein